MKRCPVGKFYDEDESSCVSKIGTIAQDIDNGISFYESGLEHGSQHIIGRAWSVYHRLLSVKEKNKLRQKYPNLHELTTTDTYGDGWKDSKIRNKARQEIQEIKRRM